MISPEEEGKLGDVVDKNVKNRPKVEKVSSRTLSSTSLAMLPTKMVFLVLVPSSIVGAGIQLSR